MKYSFFTKKLLEWNKKSNFRKMPWKNEPDPYRIWLSEIILQQTRVEQGWNYYNNFIKNYPNIHDLSNADDNEVFKLWEGLGYYNRCKNLLTTARFISTELFGVFPKTYEEVLSLKGIGPYTAAAIVSFAYGLPYAVVDGNVTRVLSRFFGIKSPIDSTKGKVEFNVLAQKLLDKRQAGKYNQAIMDFGATICKPKSPLCDVCYLSEECYAYNKNKINELPQKLKSIKIKERWFYYLVLHHKGKVHLEKRMARDVWQNLYEFVLINEETHQQSTEEDLIKKIESKFKNNAINLKKVSDFYKQKLTHQTIYCKFFILEIKKPVKIKNGEWVDKSQMKKLAFPKVIVNYLKQEFD
jgi:A/G-specific adenine glycosylase